MPSPDKTSVESPNDILRESVRRFNLCMRACENTGKAAQAKDKAKEEASAASFAYATAVDAYDAAVDAAKNPSLLTVNCRVKAKIEVSVACIANDNAQKAYVKASDAHSQSIAVRHAEFLASSRFCR